MELRSVAASDMANMLQSIFNVQKGGGGAPGAPAGRHQQPNLLNPMVLIALRQYRTNQPRQRVVCRQQLSLLSP